MAFILRFDLKVNGSTKELGTKFLDFIYHQSTVGSGWFVLRIESMDWNFLDEIYKTDSEVSIRWGYKEGDNEVWSDWYNMLVDDVRTHFYPDKIICQISGIDKCSKMNFQCSRKVWNRKKISDIASELIGSAGLTPDIEQTIGEYDLTQGTLTDAQFMRHVLLPRACSGSRTDFLLYTRRGDTVVFKPPELSQVKKTYTYINTSDAVPVGPVTLHYRPLFIRKSCSWSTEFRTVDPLKKEPEFFTVTESNIGYRPLSSGGPTVPELPAMVIPLSYEKRADFKNRCKALYSTSLRELWVAEFLSSFSPELCVGDIINLRVDVSGKTHGMAGKYILGGVIHYMGKEAWTRLFLQRRTARI